MVTATKTLLEVDDLIEVIQNLIQKCYCQLCKMTNLFKAVVDTTSSNKKCHLNQLSVIPLEIPFAFVHFAA